MMDFRDRSDAGRRLAKALSSYKGRNAVVLALPRGGVPVAAEVAAALDAPLDLILVRKIGVPTQPELAMGAVVDGTAPIVVRNEEVIELSGTTADEFDAACAEGTCGDRTPSPTLHRRPRPGGDRGTGGDRHRRRHRDRGDDTGGIAGYPQRGSRKNWCSPFPSPRPTRSRNCAGKSMP